MESKGIHCLVTGRVQGVGFRYFTKKVADRYSVCGRVRNLSDGRVEAIFIGSVQALDQVLESLRQGPPHSQVTSVAARERIVSSSMYSDFQIEGDGTIPWE